MFNKKDYPLTPRTLVRQQSGSNADLRRIVRSIVHRRVRNKDDSMRLVGRSVGWTVQLKRLMIYCTWCAPCRRYQTDQKKPSKHHLDRWLMATTTTSGLADTERSSHFHWHKSAKYQSQSSVCANEELHLDLYVLGYPFTVMLDGTVASQLWKNLAYVHQARQYEKNIKVK